MKSQFRKWCKISDRKIIQLMKLFALDLPASKVARIAWLSENTAEDRADYFRRAIHRHQCNEQNEFLEWVIEADECYFWPTRVKGKRGRWAWGKTKVFGLLKRQGKVYTQIVDDVKARTLLPIIRGKVTKWSTMNTDKFSPYDWLVDLGYEKHYRVSHGDNEFARGKQHINGIESFRSYCKRRLQKFNWVKKKKFPLYLKECEFRFNCWLQEEDVYKSLRRIVKKYNLLG